jgi:hypothetical protein
VSRVTRNPQPRLMTRLVGQVASAPSRPPLGLTPRRRAAPCSPVTLQLNAVQHRCQPLPARSRQCRAPMVPAGTTSHRHRRRLAGTREFDGSRDQLRPGSPKRIEPSGGADRPCGQSHPQIPAWLDSLVPAGQDRSAGGGPLSARPELPDRRRAAWHRRSAPAPPDLPRRASGLSGAYDALPGVHLGRRRSAHHARRGGSEHRPRPTERHGRR